MIFSELELSRLYQQHNFKTGLIRYSEDELYKEYSIFNCRFDFFSNIGDRYFAIIELKIHANVDAIMQILRYKNMISCQYPTRFKIIRLVIVAQFFDDYVITLADELRIELIQICPINRKSSKLIPMDILPSRYYLKARIFNG